MSHLFPVIFFIKGSYISLEFIVFVVHSTIVHIFLCGISCKCDNMEAKLRYFLIYDYYYVVRFANYDGNQFYINNIEIHSINCNMLPFRYSIRNQLNIYLRCSKKMGYANIKEPQIAFRKFVDFNLIVQFCSSTLTRL